MLTQISWMVAMAAMKTKELRDNCLFQTRKKYDWIDLHFERNN